MRECIGESMFPYLAPSLTRLWGPFRLLSSNLVLIGLGLSWAALLTWYFLPRLWHCLPTDRGRDFVEGSDRSRGKPTGAGFLVVLLLIPVLFLVMPLSPQLWEITACLVLAMLTGYLDDGSKRPWGEVLKGGLDLVVAVLASLALCQGEDVVLWWPLVKGASLDGSFVIPVWVYVPMATVLLWGTINATNCSDGVDSLAGSLTLLALFYLGGFLYGVVGHVDFATYLLVPHNPAGARWAILVYTAAGGLAGYIWHNANPSACLMGDAGSRFLGLLLGVAVLAAGNPFLIMVVAPVILVNGGSGLVKLALLRGLKRLGVDVRPPGSNGANGNGNGMDNADDEPDPGFVVRMLHRIRFPLHDHCRRNLGWSDPQVLVRFVLLQALLTPLLLGILVKVR